MLTLPSGATASHRRPTLQPPTEDASHARQASAHAPARRPRDPPQPPLAGDRRPLAAGRLRQGGARSGRFHRQLGADDPARLAGDHARDHHPYHRRHSRLRLVVSRVQCAGKIQPDLGLLRRRRAHRVGHPAADDHAAGRRCLGELARTGPVGPDRLQKPADRGAGRLARLEVAVHLPAAAYRPPSTRSRCRPILRCTSR